MAWDLPSFYCDDCAPAEENFMFFDESDDRNALVAYAGFVHADEGHSSVLMTNYGTKTIRLEPGQVVGSVSSVVVKEVSESSREVNVVMLDEQPRSGSVGDGDMGTAEIPSYLSEDQRGAVGRILSENKDVFSSPNVIGELDVTPHRIELTDYTPIYQRARRFPEVVNQEIERQCEELRLMDVIEPSKSAWSSPVVPVKKKDGTIRLCVDYRKLNAVTRADKFPIPNLSDAVFGLHGMCYFTALDLSKGYYQFPIDKQSRKYTAFSTPRAHWQFKNLSFGLRNAPAAFQRGMQEILNEFPWRKVIVYIDDILIMSETFDEHMDLLRRVMITLRKAGVKLNLSKCKLVQQEVEFLGHMVSRDGLRKPDSYIEDVVNFPKPTTKTELKRFLGLVNFQRKFVKNCSGIMKPLCQATGGKKSKRAIISWTPEMDAAFEQLKEAMREEITLAFPDYSGGAEPLSLFTDASSVAVGGCLAQVQGDSLRPIAFGSMTFNEAQKNYSTLDRELAAIRWAVKAFRGFLLGVEFIIHTDHRPLVYLHNMQIVNSRLARTLQELSEFSFVIRYTPGRDNTAADAMSRIPAAASEEPGAQQHPLPVGVFPMTPVPGGGDSMVLSLQAASQGVALSREVPLESLVMRRLLVDELRDNSIKYNLIGTKELPRSLKLMRHTGQLMSHECLMAFSSLFRCVVLVHYGGLSPVIYAEESLGVLGDLPRIHLRCVSGVHYDPLAEGGLYIPPSSLNSSLGVVSSPQSAQVGGFQADLEIIESEDEVDNAGVENGLVTADVEVQQVSTSDEWCLTHRPSQMLSFLATCNDTPCCVLMDTGAQVSCVADRVLSEIGVPFEEVTNRFILGLGHSRSRVLGQASLELRMPDGSKFLHSFVVVSQETMSWCCLLGIDFIDKYSLIIDFTSMNCCYDWVSWSFSGMGALPAVHSSAVMSLTADPVDGDREELTGVFHRDRIQRMQTEDRNLMKLRRLLNSGVEKLPMKKFARYRKRLRLVGDLIMFQNDHGRNVPVVPLAFLLDVVLTLHYRTAHPGRTKLLESILKHLWCPSVAGIVADVTRCCVQCQKMKVSQVEVTHSTHLSITGDTLPDVAEVLNLLSGEEDECGQEPLGEESAG